MNINNRRRRKDQGGNQSIKHLVYMSQLVEPTLVSGDAQQEDSPTALHADVVLNPQWVDHSSLPDRLIFCKLNVTNDLPSLTWWTVICLGRSQSMVTVFHLIAHCYLISRRSLRWIHSNHTCQLSMLVLFVLDIQIHILLTYLKPRKENFYQRMKRNSNHWCTWCYSKNRKFCQDPVE